MVMSNALFPSRCMSYNIIEHGPGTSIGVHCKGFEQNSESPHRHIARIPTEHKGFHEGAQAEGQPSFVKAASLRGWVWHAFKHQESRIEHQA